MSRLGRYHNAQKIQNSRRVRSTTKHTFVILTFVLVLAIFTPTDASRESVHQSLLDLFESMPKTTEAPILTTSHAFTFPDDSITIVLVGVAGALALTFVAYSAISTSNRFIDFVISDVPPPLPISTAPTEDLPALMHFTTASISPPISSNSIQPTISRKSNKRQGNCGPTSWSLSIPCESPPSTITGPPKLVRGDSDVIHTFGTDRPEVYLSMLRKSVKQTNKCSCPCGHHSPPFVQKREMYERLNGKKDDSSAVHVAHVPPSSPCTSGRNSATGVPTIGYISIPLAGVESCPNNTLSLDAKDALSFKKNMSTTTLNKLSSGLDSSNSMDVFTAPPPAPFFSVDESVACSAAASLKGVTVIPSDIDYPCVSPYEIPNNPPDYDVSTDSVNDAFDPFEAMEEGLCLKKTKIDSVASDPAEDIRCSDTQTGGTCSMDIRGTNIISDTLKPTTITEKGSSSSAVMAVTEVGYLQGGRSVVATAMVALVSFVIWMLEGLLFGTNAMRRHMISEFEN